MTMKLQTLLFALLPLWLAGQQPELQIARASDGSYCHQYTWHCQLVDAIGLPRLDQGVHSWHLRLLYEDAIVDLTREASGQPKAVVYTTIKKRPEKLDGKIWLYAGQQELPDAITLQLYDLVMKLQLYNRPMTSDMAYWEAAEQVRFYGYEFADSSRYRFCHNQTPIQITDATYNTLFLKQTWAQMSSLIGLEDFRDQMTMNLPPGEYFSGYYTQLRILAEPSLPTKQQMQLKRYAWGRH